MTKSSPSTQVQRFVDELSQTIAAAIATGSPIEPEARQCAKSLIAALKAPAVANLVEPVVDLPALEYLGQAIDAAQAGDQPIAALAQAFSKIANRLPWYRRVAPQAPDFAEGHANAQIIGPRGLEMRGNIIVGVSLMAPNIRYPDHKHPPQEIYLVMSEGEWRNQNTSWQSPGYGGLVYNPANITHTMRAGNLPLLAIWCLW